METRDVSAMRPWRMRPSELDQKEGASQEESELQNEAESSMKLTKGKPRKNLETLSPPHTHTKKKRAGGRNQQGGGGAEKKKSAAELDAEMDQYFLKNAPPKVAAAHLDQDLELWRQRKEAEAKAAKEAKEAAAAAAAAAGAAPAVEAAAEDVAAAAAAAAPTDAAA